MAASLELLYTGLAPWQKFAFVPYGYYDIGTVWNENIDQQRKISGASAGIGIHIYHDSGAAANFLMAKPLTKPADTPLYGAGQKSPRFLFQLSYGF